MNEVEESEVKIVIMGDDNVGKTCLIKKYGEKHFQNLYTPTVSDTYEGACTYNGKEVNLKVWDTPG